MNKLSIVTFFLNEAENLPRLREQLCPVLEQLEVSAEIILVDDHSTDASSDIAQAWVRQQPEASYIRLSRNCGSHAAIAAGLQACTGNCAVIMAADLQDPPDFIPRLLERWQLGYDVVWACRSLRENESWRTRAASAIYYRIMRWVALPEMPPKGADYLLVGRNVIDTCNSIAEKHTSLFAMILWMGFRQSTIEYVKVSRHSGKSKWTLSKKTKLFVDSIVSFSYVPIRLMSSLGIVMAAAGFLYAATVVVGRFTGWVSAGTGFAALMTVLLVGQGSILTMLGVLGEYLWRAYDEARGRPKYIVEKHVSSKKAECTTHTGEN